MQYSQLLVLMSFFFSFCFASPTSYHKQAKKESGIAERQVVATVAAIVTIAQDIVTDLIDLDESIEDKEGAFTVQAVETLRAEYPDKNVLVYHDQDSGYNLYNAVHSHYELDLLLGFTNGYEIWIFDYGTFELAGDRGYVNWAYGGNYESDGASVTFYQN